MINRKILAGLLLTCITVSWMWVTFADNSGTWTINNWTSSVQHTKWVSNKLTDTEKTNLKTMTAEQKKAFYANKKLEQKAVMNKKMTNKKLKSHKKVLKNKKVN